MLNFETECWEQFFFVAFVEFVYSINISKLKEMIVVTEEELENFSKSSIN